MEHYILKEKNGRTELRRFPGNHFVSEVATDKDEWMTASTAAVQTKEAPAPGAIEHEVKGQHNF